MTEFGIAKEDTVCLVSRINYVCMYVSVVML